MATQAFTIGGIAFDPTLFEVPQDFQDGLETWGSTHRLPQTDSAPPKIIAQIFGVFPKTMRWEARFLGTQAETKKRALKGMQIAGQSVKLVLGRNAWDVIIFDLQFTTRSRYDIGFSIEVRPLTDRGGSTRNGTLSQGAASSLDVQTQALKALTAAQATADARTAQLVAAANAALAAVATYAPVQQQSVSNLQLLSGYYAAVASGATTLSGSLASSVLPADAPVYNWAQQVLGVANAYLSTLSTIIGTSPSVVVAAAPGNNAFALAATQLGDWTRFGDILTANGLTDPFNIATAVTIPRY